MQLEKACAQPWTEPPKKKKKLSNLKKVTKKKSNCFFKFNL